MLAGICERRSEDPFPRDTEWTHPRVAVFELRLPCFGLLAPEAHYTNYALVAAVQGEATTPSWVNMPSQSKPIHSSTTCSPSKRQTPRPTC
jgi:hypothetical protein